MDYSIGKIAKKSGVGIDAIRFYEQKGLLPIPARAANGYRLYQEDAIKRLRFIANAKSLGFTLKEIKELLLLNDGDFTCNDILNLTQEKINMIRQRIIQLQRIESALKSLNKNCKTKGTADFCPIIEALSERGEEHESRVNLF